MLKLSENTSNGILIFKFFQTNRPCNSAIMYPLTTFILKCTHLATHHNKYYKSQTAGCVDNQRLWRHLYLVGAGGLHILLVDILHHTALQLYSMAIPIGSYVARARLTAFLFDLAKY